MLTKQNKTCIEKYGTEWPMQNLMVQAKAAVTSLERYGTFHVAQSPAIKARQIAAQQEAARKRKYLSSTLARKETVKERYGVDNVAELKEVQDKRRASFESKRDTLVFYQEPRVNEIQAEDLILYRLDVEYANKWLDKYHPFKSTRGTVLALGLCDNDQCYCIMTFRKCRSKEYVAELSRLWMLPTYEVIGGYQRLSQYASELGLYNIVAYVNLSFENVNDYQSIGMKHVRNIQRTKWWLRNDEMISDASRRQMKLSQNDMVFKGYKYAYDCGVAVYEYVE